MPELPPPHLTALRRLITTLADERVLWAVTGSVGFALQGVPVAVHDLDVQTDAAGAYEIARRFAPFVERPIQFASAERIRSHFGVLRLDGVAVEIMGDISKRLPDGIWEAPVPLPRHRRWVSVGGLRVPVLSLEYELDAYRLLGRDETVWLLEEWLRSHRHHPAPEDVPLSP